MSKNERPLVSFIVVAYNQEKYIEEAIRGAFSQTYEPLEIILSDDNSPDKTFEIMQRLAEEYDGPHKVILNRNEPNLGIGGHINCVMELSKGEFIVVNAGDDISFPERSMELVAPWLEDRSRKLIYSNSMLIDLGGHIVGRSTDEADLSNKSLTTIAERNLCCSGATVGIDRSVYDFFGALLNTVRHEDRAWATRAKLLGNIYAVDKPLIKYRIEGGVSRGKLTKLDWIGRNSTSWYEHFICDYQQKIEDIKAFNSINNESEKIDIYKLEVQKEILAHKLKLAKNELTFKLVIKNNLIPYKVKLKLIAGIFIKKGMRVK